MKYPPYDRYYDMQTMWFGVIPFNWKTTNFRNILIGISDGTHGTHQRTITGKPLLSAKNVFNDSIKISENESRISEEEYKLIIAKGYPKKGDLLVTCVGTLGRSIVYPYEEPLAFQRSVAFLRLEKKYDLKYFKYLIESKGYQDFLVNTANVSAQGGIYMGDLAASEIVLPSLAEQTKIATFLDYKTAQIDQLIEKKKALIERLNEQRIAIITQAVTKGLNPDAPMKDSGVDWLGEVPKHWSTFAIKRKFKIVNGATPKSGEERFWNGEIIWITPADFSHCERGFISKSIRKITHEGFESCGTSLVPKSSIIVTSRAPIGKVVQAGKNLCTNQGCKSLIVDTDCAAHRFYYYSLLANSEKLNSLGLGTTFMELSNSDLGLFNLPFPPLSEQIQIVKFLDYKTTQIDQLIEKKKTLIEKLKEYRTALITAAVTGKIDVRGFDINKNKTNATTKKRESADAG